MTNNWPERLYFNGRCCFCLLLKNWPGRSSC